MCNGRICSVVVDRGFGFIRPGANEEWDGDVFFHLKSLVGLEFGEHIRELEVTYDLIDTERGKRAVNVKARD